jgi:Carboxypeptidase regulatory-like domain
MNRFLILAFLLILAALAGMLWSEPELSEGFAITPASEDTDSPLGPEIGGGTSAARDSEERGNLADPGRVVGRIETEGEADQPGSSKATATVLHRARGQVITNGAGVAGAIVRLYEGEVNYAGAYSRPARREIEVDEQGYFHFEGALASVSLIPSRPGYASKDVFFISAKAAVEVQGVVLELFPAAKIFGSVEHQGERLAGLWLSVRLENGWDRARIGGDSGTSYRALPPLRWSSDPQGEFSGLVADGNYQLSFSPPSRPQSEAEKRAAKFAAASIQAKPGDSPVVLQLKLKQNSGFNLRGTVVDPSGNPVARAEVLFIPSGPSTQSQIDGSFVLEEVKQDWLNPPEIAAWAPGFAPNYLTIPKLEADLEPVLISLLPAVSIAGTLLDEEGAPIPKAIVRLSGEREYQSRSTLAETLLNAFQEPESSRPINIALTNEAGRFQFDSISAGTYACSYHGKKDFYYAPISQALARIEVESGNTDVILQVGKFEEQVVLRGTVRDALTGQALPSAEITVMRDMGALNSGIAFLDVEANGSFEFQGLDSGKYALSLTAPGYAPSSTEMIEYETGEYSFELSLHPARDLALTVLDPEGNPAPGIQVYAINPEGKSLMMALGGGGRSSRAVTDDHGQVILSGLPATLITVQVAFRFPQPLLSTEYDLRSVGPHRLQIQMELMPPLDPVQVLAVFMPPEGADLASLVNQADRPLVLTLYNAADQPVSRMELWYDGSGWKQLATHMDFGARKQIAGFLDVPRTGARAQISGPSIPLQSHFIPPISTEGGSLKIPIPLTVAG